MNALYDRSLYGIPKMLDRHVLCLQTLCSSFHIYCSLVIFYLWYYTLFRYCYYHAQVVGNTLFHKFHIY